MGQSASKALRETAKKISHTSAGVVDLQKPLPPGRFPNVPFSESSSSSGLQSLSPPPTVPVVPTAANPGNFLRGDGIAKNDIRDVGQAMYLQHVQDKWSQQQEQEEVDRNVKTEQQQTASSSTATTTTGTTEMSEELLKFIQNVGPAQQGIDREFTAPRLLQEENSVELQKLESVRRPARQRRKMPLMGQDQRFVTEKNTNFSSLEQEENDDDLLATRSTSTKTKKVVGLENFQLYQFLEQNEKESNQSKEKKIEAFCEKLAVDGHAQTWTETEIQQLNYLLQQTLQHIEIPVLCMDMDGNNMLGLYPKDVPAPEVKSVSTIPDTKVMLVLKDLASRHNNDMNDGGTATNRLIERRKDRSAAL
jgi:hypothetical protein